MPKEEWGVKRVCPTTGKRFYDMNNDPIVSPYTGEVVVVDQNTKTRTLIADKADKSTASKDDDEDNLIDDDDVLVDDDEDDADVDLGDDVLDDEDDDDTVSLDDIADVSDDSDDDN